jgi:hypothetical protein
MSSYAAVRIDEMDRIRRWHTTRAVGEDVTCACSGAGWACAPCFSHRDEHLPGADHVPDRAGSVLAFRRDQPARVAR